MKSKRIISLLLITVVLFTINISVFGIDNFAVGSIVYITEKETKDLIISGNEINIVQSKNIGEIVGKQLVNVWVNEDVMENPETRNVLEEVYKNNGRVVIVGENITRNELRNYFGLKTREYIMNGDKQEENTIELKSIGKLIYKEGGINNVTDILLEKYNDEEETMKALLYCTRYDYVSLINGEQKPSSLSIFENNICYAESDDWTNIDVDSATHVYTRAIITLLLKMDENDGNPNSQGEYLYYSTYKTDIDVRTDGSDMYGITDVKLDNAGYYQSAIYDYAPHDRGSSSATVTFGLPWAMSVSFNPETRVKINKISGGIDSSNVKIQYLPVSLLGIGTIELNGMWCENHFEAYQPDNTYFYNKGTYYIETCEVEFDGGGGAYPISKTTYTKGITITN